LLNTILSKTLGVRLIREQHLKDAGFYAHRDETKKINDKAAQRLHVLTTVNGKSLAPALKRKADEYAVEVLGNRDYAPWLYVYSAMRGKFLEGWMPENYYHLVVVPMIMKGLVDVTAMKSFSNLLLRSKALPDIAYNIDGICYDREYRVISRKEMAALASSHDRVFVKGDGGGAGSKIQKIPGGALHDHMFLNDCAVQSPIHPHPFFEEFIPDAAPTLRITTAKTPQGNVELRGARLRLGLSGTEWLTADNGVKIAIMDDEGTLDELGYMPDWRACPAHPDSGVRFAGRKVPFFAQVAELCRNLHAKLPHFAVIGWDALVNREGNVELIEWNGGHCAISFEEALNGPHFNDMGWERFAQKRSGVRG
jgi:hypothetical protein